MSDNPHDAEDTAIYEKQGFGNRIGFGKKPALLIIDFINGFNDPDAFGGGNIQDAIDKTAELLAVARHMDQPRLCRGRQRGRRVQPEIAGTCET
jgi:hypothetical protein